MVYPSEVPDLFSRITTLFKYTELCVLALSTEYFAAVTYFIAVFFPKVNSELSYRLKMPVSSLSNFRESSLASSVVEKLK